MDDKLKKSFHDAYTGEAKAVLRLLIFARKAEEEGYTQMAKLFRAVARSEEVHGERAMRMLREIKSTEQNLADSFESETKIAGLAYDAMIKMAGELGDETAALILSQSRDVEDIHAKLYKEAMGHLMEERETVYHLCKVCGYVSDGVLPDVCPICGAKSDQFEKIE